MTLCRPGDDYTKKEVIQSPDLPETPKNENGFWKYHEDVILKEIRDYLGNTYNAHYTSKESQTQTLDLIEGIGDAETFLLDLMLSSISLRSVRRMGNLNLTS